MLLVSFQVSRVKLGPVMDLSVVVFLMHGLDCFLFKGKHEKNSL